MMRSPDKAQTFLDHGTRFEGRILVTGTVRLDGYFKGDGRAQGTLVVGESGEVEAELEVESFVVNGSFKGNVVAKNRVEIGSTGRFQGSVITPCLRVHDGGQLNARVQMGEAARRDAKPEPASQEGEVKNGSTPAGTYRSPGSGESSSARPPHAEAFARDARKPG